jgi:hypothetical protein
MFSAPIDASTTYSHVKKPMEGHSVIALARKLSDKVNLLVGKIGSGPVMSLGCLSSEKLCSEQASELGKQQV